MSNKSKAKSPPKVTVEDLQQQVAQLIKALQHERADAENIRRRHDEQISGLRDMVKASVIRDFLPVIDNYERLLKHISSDSKDGPWKQGVEQISRQLEKALLNMGVERIKTVGEQFDPHLHEAISMDDTGGHHEIVSEELQTGYVLGDNVIRHAMVRVKKEKAK